jgi:hypothetical protein
MAPDPESKRVILRLIHDVRRRLQELPKDRGGLLAAVRDIRTELNTLRLRLTDWQAEYEGEDRDYEANEIGAMGHAVDGLLQSCDYEDGSLKRRAATPDTAYIAGPLGRSGALNKLHGLEQAAERIF